MSPKEFLARQRRPVQLYRLDLADVYCKAIAFELESLAQALAIVNPLTQREKAGAVRLTTLAMHKMAACNADIVCIVWDGTVLKRLGF